MKFINSIKNHLLLITFIYFILFVFFWFLLSQLGFVYLLWFKIVSVLFIGLGIIFGTILKVKRTNYKKKDKIVLSLLYVSFELFISVIAICVVSFSLIYQSEKLVFVDDKLYVERRYSFLVANHIDYYRFSNIFFRTKQASFTKDYNNSFSDSEYIGTTYYDEDGNVINHPSNSSSLQAEEENVLDSTAVDSSAEVLYTQQIDDRIFFRISKIDNILAGRNIVIVEKSIDGGITYTNQLQLENDIHTLTVYDGADYVFLNEKIGFINNHSVSGDHHNNRGMMVTIDGGQTFQKIKILVEKDMLDYLFFQDLPYFLDKNLKMTGLLYFTKEPKAISFVSYDGGLTWEQE